MATDYTANAWKINKRTARENVENVSAREKQNQRAVKSNNLSQKSFSAFEKKQQI